MSQSAVQLFMLPPSGCIKHYTQSIFTILIIFWKQNQLPCHQKGFHLNLINIRRNTYQMLITLIMYAIRIPNNRISIQGILAVRPPNCPNKKKKSSTAQKCRITVSTSMVFVFSGAGARFVSLSVTIDTAAFWRGCVCLKIPRSGTGRSPLRFVDHRSNIGDSCFKLDFVFKPHKTCTSQTAVTLWSWGLCLCSSSGPPGVKGGISATSLLHGGFSRNKILFVAEQIFTGPSHR